MDKKIQDYRVYVESDDTCAIRGGKIGTGHGLQEDRGPLARSTRYERK